MTAYADPWITCFRPNPAARLRLFCLPYAGSGTSVYRTWPETLPADVEVCPVQLPGRETRLKEPPATRLAALVQDVADGLRPYLDRPFVLFGHSMGALLAFELARQVRRRRYRPPVRLVVSGRAAPQIAPRDEVLHTLPEPEFVRELRRRYNGIPEAVLQSRELMAYFLPVLRADIALLETHVYAAEAPLECPIAAFGGRQDPTVHPAALDAWKAHTTGTFARQTFPGDHFFISTARTLVLGALARELQQDLDSLAER